MATLDGMRGKPLYIIILPSVSNLKKSYESYVRQTFQWKGAKTFGYIEVILSYLRDTFHNHFLSFKQQPPYNIFIPVRLVYKISWERASLAHCPLLRDT